MPNITYYTSSLWFYGMVFINVYKFIIIVSPVRSTYGGYYELVVVPPRPRLPPPRPRLPPPRPQTLHRSHDNLQNPYRIASIFYM